MRAFKLFSFVMSTMANKFECKVLCANVDNTEECVSFFHIQLITKLKLKLRKMYRNLEII